MQHQANEVPVSTVRYATATELEDENVKVCDSESQVRCGDSRERLFGIVRRGYDVRLNSRNTQRCQQATGRRKLKELQANIPRHGLQDAGC